MAPKARRFLFFHNFLFLHHFLFLLAASSSTTLHDTITFPTTTFPTNPGSTPATIPSTTPVPIPINNPVAEPGPVTGAGGDAPPVFNPVTANPPPAGIIQSVPPPAVTNGPEAPGESWCVARAGIPEDVLQDALDYACGIGGADCSQIQEGGSCYNPNTLENHASYAFNSYYQKSPIATSCNFGGAAALVSTNPSSGSCIYQSSPTQSSTSSSTTPVASPTTPVSSAPPTTVTPSPPSTGTTPVPSTQTPTTPITSPTTPPGLSGSGTSPPLVFNPTNPTSGTAVYGPSAIPPNLDTSTTTSKASRLEVLTGCLAVITSIVTGLIALND